MHQATRQSATRQNTVDAGRRADGRHEAGPARSRAVLPALLVLLAVPWTSLAAQDRGGTSLDFDAFGTLGAVYSSEDRADFVWNPVRPDGPGHSETVSPDVDSRIGGQVTLQVGPELTAIVQVVAEQTWEDDYAPHVEWANVRWDVTPDLSLRLGRTALAGLMVSDHRKISYANPWIRPPVELYSLLPVYYGDGLDASYRLHVGDWTGTLVAGVGRSETDFPGGYSAESDYGWGVHATVHRSGFTGRAAFSHGVLDIEAFDPLFDAFRAFGPDGEAIADRYDVDDTPYHFASVGGRMDALDWFATGELGWANFHSALGEKLAGYVSGGHRFGPLTPYVTYARVGALNETSTRGLTTSTLPPALAGAAAELNEGLDAFLRAAPVQQSVSVGGRWDYAPGMALELQVDLVDVLDGSPGFFVNPQPGFEKGGDAALVSLATSFVF